MFITKKTEYAVRCMMYLAAQGGKVVNNNEISSAMGVPRCFLAKILQALIKSGIVNSTRGIEGGYTLARIPDEISLFEVVEAVQGPFKLNICDYDENTCDFCRTCLLKKYWLEIQNGVERELRSRNFSDFAGRVKTRDRVDLKFWSCSGLSGGACCNPHSAGIKK